MLPLILAPAGDTGDEPLFQWALGLLQQHGGPFEAVGETITADSMRRGFQSLRDVFRQLGITHVSRLTQWLQAQGFSSESNYIN